MSFGGSSRTTSTTDTRPAGPSATIDEELDGGAGVFIGTAEPGKLDEGYVEEEYVASGTATSYVGVGERTADGRWTLEPGDTATYGCSTPHWWANAHDGETVVLGAVAPSER